MKSFHVTYDGDSDVLYISVRKAPAARGIEDGYGIVWRYDGDGELIGATIVGFHDDWFNNRPTLSDEISRRFEIPSQQARVIVDQAMNGTGAD
jgi:uncharacterized protein YuzE